MNTVIALAIVFFLAYANGANDNFKGVATLFGDEVRFPYFDDTRADGCPGWGWL